MQVSNETAKPAPRNGWLRSLLWKDVAAGQELLAQFGERTSVRPRLVALATREPSLRREVGQSHALFGWKGKEGDGEESTQPRNEPAVG